MNTICNMKTLKELVQQTAIVFGDKTAFCYMRKHEHIEVMYQKFERDINGFGTYLYEHGIQKQNVAILGENSYEWLVSFFAVANGSNVSVPIDKELDVVSMYKNIKNAECNVILYTKSYSPMIRKIMEIEEHLFAHAICLSHMDKMVEDGNELLQAGDYMYIFEQIDKNTPAAIYFTSGTTGEQKGVILSHGNLMSNMYGASKIIQPERMVFLILPLSHTFALVASVLSVLVGGNAIYVCSGIKSFFQNIKVVKPDGLVVVPLFVESIHKTIWKKIHENNKVKSYKRLCKISNFLYKIGIDVRRKIFRSIHESLGKELKLIVCGGAPLSEQLIEEFCTWGIDILNGYGITECSPIISVNSKANHRKGSVGKPLEHVMVKIEHPDDSGKGEICVSGPNVMLGYYKDEEQTKLAVQDGWYHTGDIGYVDKEGYLFVTGRIKNLIILSNGENISPELLEDKLKLSKLVNEVLVYGKDGKITAEIYPDKDFAERHNIEDIKNEIEQDVQKLNVTLPLYQRISQIIVREEEFTKNTNRKIIRTY